MPVFMAEEYELWTAVNETLLLWCYTAVAWRLEHLGVRLNISSVPPAELVAQRLGTAQTLRAQQRMEAGPGKAQATDAASVAPPPPPLTTASTRVVLPAGERGRPSLCERQSLPAGRPSVYRARTRSRTHRPANAIPPALWMSAFPTHSPTHWLARRPSRTHFPIHWFADSLPHSLTLQPV
eukprot:GHVU01117312.1.p1 GENE.GHVU01117312.1~~GHVU01117312.1.p1  ORF type:complete len:181 (-),score=10.59 GHVU01117312.1:2161-2703(-)